jgi:hypothetical protein
MRILLLALALLVAGCTTETTRDRGVPPPGTGTTAPAPLPATPPAPPPARGPPTPAGSEVAFAPIEGCQSIRADEVYEVVNDEARWRALWAESCQPTTDGNGTSQAEPPAVDFGASSVVAAFWGQKDTGGYGIRILRITATTGGATADVERASPGPTCATTQVITYPAALVRTEAEVAQAEFRFQDQVVGC